MIGVGALMMINLLLVVRPNAIAIATHIAMITISNMKPMGRSC